MVPKSVTPERARKFGKYTVAAAIAATCSQLAFLISYAAGIVPVAATVIAWAAGAVPNYLLNRRWTWQRSSRPDARRELLPYAIIVGCTAGAAALVTTLTDSWVQQHLTSHGWQVALVSGSYLATYGVLFVLKFSLFDRFVFAASPPREVVQTPAAR